MHNSVRPLGLLCALVGVATLTKPAFAQDWTQWRGPSRSATIESFTAMPGWKPKLTKGWSVVVGDGQSSPIIVGDRVYIHTRKGENEVVQSLRLGTGSPAWTDSYPVAYEPVPAAKGHGKGPKSTPVYANGMLVTLGITGILSCYQASSGELVWRKDFAGKFPATYPEFGTAMSPVVDRNLVIVHVGGKDGGALIAYDLKSGKEIWKWTEDGPAYSSPVIAFFDNFRTVVTQTQHFCVGVSAEDGKLLWKIPFTTPYEQNSVSPVVIGGAVLFGGVGTPTFLIKPHKEGDDWKTNKVWETRDIIFYMNTPVLNGNLLYGMSQKRRGEMVSFDPDTGKVLWADTGNFGENAAVLAGGGYIFSFSNKGTLYIYRKVGNKLLEIFQQQVADTEIWATPAFATRRMFVKDLNNLTFWTIE